MQLWGWRSARWQRLARFGVLVLPLVLCGCPMTITPDGSGDGLPFLDEAGNTSFNTATALPISDTDVLEYEGRIDSASDLDIYELGTLEPGDRLYVDVRPVTAQSGSQQLDLVAAVFDSREYMHVYNDDREPDGSNLNPLLDFVIHGDRGTYFLGISTYFESSVVGDYRVTVRITRDVGCARRRRASCLSRLGRRAEYPRSERGCVRPRIPFDATDLGPYDGRTGEMKDRIQAIVADRYADYDLTLLNSDDDAKPAGAHTTVYFGGDNARAFAISEQIDPYNEDPSDDAIVFTSSYRDAFRFAPTFEQMAQAVGNTVAHELGHLFGLVHTQDCESLMDSSCSNQSILIPQEFKVAELDDSVFPVGFQPAAEILEWVLGFGL